MWTDLIPLAFAVVRTDSAHELLLRSCRHVQISTENFPIRKVLALGITRAQFLRASEMQ